MRKLEPLTNTLSSEGPKRKSIDPNAVRMVSTLLNQNDDIQKNTLNLKSRQRANVTALNPSLQNTLDGKRARKLDPHMDNVTVPASINGGFSRTNGNASIFNSISAGQTA